MFSSIFLMYSGFPVWLRDIPGIKFRTDNEQFKVAFQIHSQMYKSLSSVVYFLYSLPLDFEIKTLMWFVSECILEDGK